MEGLRRRGGVGVRLVMMLGMLIITCAVGREPVLHKVGGTQGWKPDVNYTEWSSHEHFYVGDWLNFVFDKHYFNVLEVNKTSYENCIDKDFIKNITKGGRDVFNLTELKPYYFLSGGGYCFHGMRLVVSVEDIPPPPALPPSPAKNGSPSKIGSRTILSIVLATSFVWPVILFESY